MSFNKDYNYPDNFYIDLDGDIKGSDSESKFAEFITETDKPNSQYVMAKDKKEIINIATQINSDFDLDLECQDMLKQYSIKRNKNHEIVGIKAYSGNKGLDGLFAPADFKMVLTGFDITSESVYRDFYFVGSQDDAEKIISNQKLSYVIQSFETHVPILYSLKCDESTKPINFKTYYVRNEPARIFLMNMGYIEQIKQSLRF
jgi:hypothetical protein